MLFAPETTATIPRPEVVLPELFDGHADNLDYDPLRAYTPGEPQLVVSYKSPIYGMRLHGYHGAYPIVSGMYHNWDPETGMLEQDERVFVLTGLARGARRGDPGQTNDLCLVGPQIGRYDPRTGRLALAATPTTYQTDYHWSSCFDRRHVDRDQTPIIANPWADPRLHRLLTPALQSMVVMPRTTKQLEADARAGLAYLKRQLQN